MTSPVTVSASRRYGTQSPLRYPGGKAALAGLFADVIRELGLSDPIYVEPYAGGAGAGVALLRAGLVEELVINDLDPAVFSFWHSVVHENEELVDRILRVPLTIEEWRRQREVYRASDASDPLALGFAFFYLNRTNRSGVLSGGVIGGLAQGGTYKMDARFNRVTLSDRILALGQLADRISVRDDDGRSVIRQYAEVERAFLYVDPPYVRAGSDLYLNAFDARDHTTLATAMHAVREAHWLMTYDVAPLILDLYQDHFVTRYELNYSARHPGRAAELLIASPDVAVALRNVTSSSPAT